jgi:hypothetical protein
MQNSGYSLLRDPRKNKGTAFSSEERKQYGLQGILPDVIETIETQILRVNEQLNSVESPINKYIYLTNLLESNETLFFKTIISDPAKFLPLVYTPTVGEACQRFGHIARKPRGLFISIEQKTTNKNPRSTVGTVTEVYDFLRLLYARIGEAYSYNTGKKMVKWSEEEIVENIFKKYKYNRFQDLKDITFFENYGK